MLSAPYNAKVLAYYEAWDGKPLWPESTAGVVTRKSGSASAGELMVLQYRIEADVIKETRFAVFGCGYSIACCAYVAEQINGQSPGQITGLDEQILIQTFDIPPHKVHCAVTAMNLVV